MPDSPLGVIFCRLLSQGRNGRIIRGRALSRCRICSYARSPPYSAGAFVRDHAGTYWCFRGTGAAINLALVWIYLSQNHARAFATGGHLAGALASLGIESRELNSRIVFCKALVERETGSGNNTDATPIGIRIMQRFSQVASVRTGFRPVGPAPDNSYPGSVCLQGIGAIRNTWPPAARRA